VSRNIPVTQPFMPLLEEFIPYLSKICESKWLSNAGAFHQQLERELTEYLDVEHLPLFTNGTIVLVTALHSLRTTGEVITTFYSFVATAHPLLWNNVKPVFVGIDPILLNLDPEKIESAITPSTTAIMPVHCYGNACEVERIQKLWILMLGIIGVYLWRIYDDVKERPLYIVAQQLSKTDRYEKP